MHVLTHAWQFQARLNRKFDIGNGNQLAGGKQPRGFWPLRPAGTRKARGPRVCASATSDNNQRAPRQVSLSAFPAIHPFFGRQRARLSESRCRRCRRRRRSSMHQWRMNPNCSRSLLTQSESRRSCGFGASIALMEWLSTSLGLDSSLVS